MSDFDLVDVSEQPTAVVQASVPMAELPVLYDRAFGAVFSTLEQQGVAPAGEPFGYYRTMPADGHVDVEVGVAVSAPIEASGDVVASSLPGGRAAHGFHIGGYDTLPTTYAALQEWATGQGLELGPVWECYLTDPSAEPDQSKWRTEVFWLVAD